MLLGRYPRPCGRQIHDLTRLLESLNRALEGTQELANLLLYMLIKLLRTSKLLHWQKVCGMTLSSNLMLQYQKNATPCVLRTFLNCMAVQSFSFAGIFISTCNCNKKPEKNEKGWQPNSDVNSTTINKFTSRWPKVIEHWRHMTPRGVWVHSPNPKSKRSEIPFHAFWKVFYRVLKITKHPIKAWPVWNNLIFCFNFDVLK